MESWIFTEPSYELSQGKLTDLTKKCNLLDQNQELRVLDLDWTEFEEENLPNDLDIVVGSDLVYSKPLLPGLCSLIKILLDKVCADNRKIN